mgnify:FL=1
MNKKDFFVYSGSSLRDALKQIDKNRNGIILVCTEDHIVKGLSTDGDIRRQLLINDDLNQIIDNCINKSFVYVKENSSHEEIYKLMDSDIRALPVLNNDMKLKSIITIDNLPLRSEGLISARAKSPVRISFGGGGSDTTTSVSYTHLTLPTKA